MKHPKPFEQNTEANNQNDRTFATVLIEHYQTKMAMMRITGVSSRLRLQPHHAEALYDDDPAWNEVFANSLETLQRLGNEALKDYHEGRTEELDPDKL